MAYKRVYRLVGWALASSLLAAFLLFKHGAEAVLVVALIVVCAYLNVLFLKLMLNGFKQRNAKSMAIAIGALLANIAALYVTDFSLLTGVVVWLPAIAGILAVRLLRGS